MMIEITVGDPVVVGSLAWEAKYVSELNYFYSDLIHLKSMDFEVARCRNWITFTVI